MDAIDRLPMGPEQIGDDELAAFVAKELIDEWRLQDTPLSDRLVRRSRTFHVRVFEYRLSEVGPALGKALFGNHWLY